MAKKSPKPPNLKGYSNERWLFDKALHDGGGKFTVNSEKQAQHLRFRLNMFRSLLREKHLREGKEAMTIYDDLCVGIDDCSVIIEYKDLNGVYETLPNASPRPETWERAERDETLSNAELERQAKELKEKLGIADAELEWPVDIKVSLEDDE